MKLARAIEIVGRDTRENTDPTISDIDACKMVIDELTIDDLRHVEDLTTLAAYLAVMHSDKSELAQYAVTQIDRHPLDDREFVLAQGKQGPHDEPWGIE